MVSLTVECGKSPDASSQLESPHESSAELILSQWLLCIATVTLESAKASSALQTCIKLPLMFLTDAFLEK